MADEPTCKHDWRVGELGNLIRCLICGAAASGDLLNAQTDALRARIAALSAWAAAWKDAAKYKRRKFNEEKAASAYLLRQTIAAGLRVADLERIAAGWTELCEVWKRDETELRARIAALEAALRWYADPANYEQHYDARQDDYLDSDVVNDEGNRARRALGES